MHGRRSTVLSSVTAICLMVLLLFIHAVKLLHTHDHNAVLSASNKQHKGYTAGASPVCSICSFEYVRDAAMPGCTLAIAPPAIALPITIEFLFTIPAADVLAITARGPPARA